MRTLALFLVVGMLGIAPATQAIPFSFSTGNPDGLVGTASRPDSAGFEIETGDDFILPNTTTITGASILGLVSSGTALSDFTSAVLEIYRVFPSDSDVGRTSGPPTFSTSAVPTRANSPSDVAFASAASGADFTTNVSLLAQSFTVANSVRPGGINPIPGQTTGGDGGQSGEEVLLTFALSNPFVLPAGHYFFVPQVDFGSDTDFLWLSAPKPIVAPGTSFLPDLQTWTRDEALSPDWLRVGTDIIGAGAFNAAFTLTGVAAAVPEPPPLALAALAFGMLMVGRRLRR